MHDGKVRRLFCILPIIPRVLIFFNKGLLGTSQINARAMCAWKRTTIRKVIQLIWICFMPTALQSFFI